MNARKIHEMLSVQVHPTKANLNLRPAGVYEGGGYPSVEIVVFEDVTDVPSANRKIKEILPALTKLVKSFWGGREWEILALRSWLDCFECLSSTGGIAFTALALAGGTVPILITVFSSDGMTPAAGLTTSAPVRILQRATVRTICIAGRGAFRLNECKRL